MNPDIYTIWYGCKHERTAYSGSLSLQNLNNPTLRIWLKGGVTNTATGKTYGDLQTCLQESVLVTSDTSGDTSTFNAHPGLSTDSTKKGFIGGFPRWYLWLCGTQLQWCFFRQDRSLHLERLQ